MNPIKNPDTEQFCQQVAEVYKTDAKSAHNMFIEYITKNKGLVYWEQIAMNIRIKHIIKENK